MLFRTNLISRRSLCLAFVAAGASTSAAQTPDAAESARAFVVAIYRNYESDAAMRRFKWTSNTQLQRLFDRQLAQTIRKDLDSGENSIGFDPFVNSQDPETRRTVVTVDQVQGDRAVVTARAQGLPEPTTVQYILTRGAQGWRIRNMTWPGQTPPMDSLRKMLNLPD